MPRFTKVRRLGRDQEKGDWEALRADLGEVLEDGLIPQAPSAGSGSPEEFMPRLRQMAKEAGRDPQSLSVTLGGAPEDLDVLKRNRDLGVARMTVRLPPAKEGEILPILDRWAKLIPQVKT